MMSNDKKLTPQLRFKEFKNSGEWEEKKLGEISSIVKEKLGKNNYTLLSITAGHGLVSQLEKFGKEIAGSSYENYIVIHKNDFAYNKSATKDYQSGYVALLQTYDVAAVPNSIFLCFRVDETILNVFFLEQLFKFNYHDKYLRKLIQIGARAHGSLNISNKDFFSMPIPIPPLKEQQKIADFLSSVDELIMLEKIKLEKLKEYKKGLLQNLFPKENQKVPDLRFSDFKNSGDWEEKKLGDIVDILDNLRQPIAKYKRVQGRYPYYGANGIMDYINNYIFDGTYLLIGEDGSVINKNNSPVMHIATGKFWVNNHTHVVQEKNKLYNLFFIYYTLHNADIEGFVKGIPPKLNQENLRQLSVMTTNIEEQRKIANFMLLVDELIIEQIKTIEMLQEYKKGLLQQVFVNKF